MSVQLSQISLQATRKNSLTQYPTLTNILISCSKSKSGREKRSEGETYFQPSDIVIPGISSGGENTWKVEFAVLFPVVNEQAPQPSPPVEIIEMLHERKETIEKAVGSKIKGMTAKPNVQPSKKSNFALFFKKIESISKCAKWGE